MFAEVARAGLATESIVPSNGGLTERCGGDGVATFFWGGLLVATESMVASMFAAAARAVVGLATESIVASITDGAAGFAAAGFCAGEAADDGELRLSGNLKRVTFGGGPASTWMPNEVPQAVQVNLNLPTLRFFAGTSC